MCQSRQLFHLPRSGAVNVKRVLRAPPGARVDERLTYNGGIMPKLYEYLGIIVLFYSNEHEPVHVHGKYQGREMRAELVIRDGRVVV
jgi:hypothetical protein